MSFVPIIVGTPKMTQAMVHIFRTFGLWTSTKSPSSSSAYKIYSILLHLIFSLVYSICIWIQLFKLRNNIEELIDSMGMAITLLAFNIKLLNIYVHNAKFKSCLLDVTNFKLNNIVEKSIKDDKIRRFQFIVILFYGMVFLANVSLYVPAIQTATLPFLASYPEWFSANYKINFVYQMIGMTMISTMNVTMELYPSYLMYMLSMKLEVLGLRLRSLGLGVVNKSEFQGCVDRVDQKRAVRQFCAALQCHQDILR